MGAGLIAQLKMLVRPLGPGVALTLEQASSAVVLNCDVARFHVALAHAERAVDLEGALDGHLERELVARATQISRARDALVRERGGTCAAPLGAPPSR